VTGPSIRAHQNILNACQQFSEYFERRKFELGGAYSAWLDGFRYKVCQQLAFTVYIVDDAADVGVIFEVMNDRGLQITDLEKVKNYLLYLATKLNLPTGHDLAEQVNNTWSHIFQSLMISGLSSTNNEDQLLRMHWIMACDYNLKNWCGSKSIKARFHLKNYIGKHEQLLDDLKKYIISLKDATTLYCDIFSPDRTDAFSAFPDGQTKNEVIAWSQKLRRLDVMAPFIPVLMATRFYKPDDPASYLELVKLCELYVFRIYKFLERRSNAGRSTLFQTAFELHTGKKTFDETLERIASLINYYSPQEKFVDETQLDDTESDWYHWGGMKYFLYEYEQHLARGKTVKITWDQLESDIRMQTIEHILPQTANKKYWIERFSAARRKQYTHDIGNLCLTCDNSSYGNRPFPDKKGAAGSSTACYAIGQTNMERKLCEYGDWTETELLDRRKKMIAWLVDRWPAPEITEMPDDIIPDDENESQ
jgi:hypothetical protein